ncbi:nitrogenase component 1 [Clostridium sp. DJ247]|uniref:nitrogenase component 1 n=1 Tax=Clostridium sp. DJ247 TaxID=2726188 RepID=UPI001625FAD3|nr:nitrogenase component 1 [Clostridium sp. DJ247]MBC2582798.1 nitrogenase associated protein N [Clostridium sp. DJ247]
MYDELIFENCNHSKDPILGCALEGVASIVAGIKDASIVIHSPQGCAATVGAAYDTHEIDFTKRKIGCTRLFESDVIMGASQKLEDLIKEADRTFNTKVMFVIGTCAADIIGEDIEGICREVQPFVNNKLIPIIAGGFRGNTYDGLNMGLEALLHFIINQHYKVPKSVNIILPQANLNPTWWADLKWVTDTLEFLGIRVQAVLPHDISFSELEDAGRASANILLSRDAGYEFVKKMEEQYGIPLILQDMPLPIGLKNTAQWLRALGKYFEVEERVEEIIKKGEEMVIDILRRRGLMIIPRYRNCKIAISADATIGIGLVRMLFEELEMIPETILLRSGLPECKKILQRELDDLGISPKVAFSVDGYQVKQALKDIEVDSVIGSAWEKYMAEEVGVKLAFDVVTPTNRDVYVDRAYFGYDGMLNILEIVANDWEKAFRSKEINWEQCM